MDIFDYRKTLIEAQYESLLRQKNVRIEGNGIFERYRDPIITPDTIPPFWKYDYNRDSNPCFMQRIGVNATLNSGALKVGDKYVVVVRVEGYDRKSFFAVAESETGVDGFRFRERPITMPESDVPATNVYDMRLTRHEDGWIYGLFCVERHDDSHPEDLSAAVASCGIARTRDLDTWERLPDLKSKSQQRNVVLHPEFVDGKYALYTRPQDSFIDTGSGGGIGWSLVDDITNAEVTEERIIDPRIYHTIKEMKNGEGPAPIKTPQGWLASRPWCEGYGKRPPLRALCIYDIPRASLGEDRLSRRIPHGPARRGVCRRRHERALQQRLDRRRLTDASSSTTPRAIPACTWPPLRSTVLWTTVSTLLPRPQDRRLGDGDQRPHRQEPQIHQQVISVSCHC